MNAIRPPASLDLVVENVHCAGCISKIERNVTAMPGVAGARYNVSTHHLRVELSDPSIDCTSVADLVSKLGYPASEFRAAGGDAGDKEEKALLLALAVAGFAAGNVMLLSVSVWAGSDMGAATRDLFHWISALIALPTVIFSGRPFFRSAWAALRHGATNMDVPISLAVILASGLSLAETIRGGEHAYFDASVTLLFFLLIGRYLDHRARSRARSAAARLLSLSGDTARVIVGVGEERLVPLAEVMPGMRVAIAAGDKIPVDGVITQGSSDIDLSLLTGEAVPEIVGEGKKVFAGTLNLTGPLVVQVSAAAGATVLAEIVKLMEAAERGKSRYTQLADRVARLYAPVVHVLALMTFIFWWVGVDASLHSALMNAVAVLIITCPCALALAVPVVRVVAHGLLFRQGILIKRPDALERLASIDTVVFDKTGTLTLGKPVLVERPGPEVLAEAASLARLSRHPLSQAVAEAAADLPPKTASGVREVAGAGVEGELDGRPIRLGRAGWAAPVSVNAADRFSGNELWFLSRDGRTYCFRFLDALKADARATVEGLQALGLKVCILSGDRVETVADVAHQLAISDWRAHCQPEEKVAAVDQLRSEGRRVLVVGDGLNDAPALAAGFISASPSTAADISRTSADIVFQGTGVSSILTAVRVARASQSRVRENIALAIAYNALAIPAAVAGLVTPLIAALAMSSSSILVTLNSLRLNRMAGRWTS